MLVRHVDFHCLKKPLNNKSNYILQRPTRERQLSTMGNAISWQNISDGIFNPDVTPRTESYPNFDPHEGFDYQRKLRGNLNSG